MPTRSFTAGGLVLAAAIALLASAEAGSAAGTHTLAVIQSGQSGGPVNPSTAPLQLTDAQRARIREVLAAKHTDVSFALKGHAAAKNFMPKVDETIPKGLVGQAFPQPLISEMPATKQFIYLKFKDQLLIVNPKTRKIVDMIPAMKG